MIIDFHTHTFPAAIAPATIDKLSRVARVRPFTDGTDAGLRASMAKAGVDLSILLPVATRPGQVAGINDHAAKANEQQGELLSFASMHPDCDAWREELARIAGLGMKGIKIHPVYQGVEQDDLRYLRILDRAGELGLIVVTHSGVDIGYPEVVQSSPEKIASAVRQVGPVNLVAAHMGGWRQWEEAACLAEFPNIFLDTSFSTGMLTPRQEGDYTAEERRLLDEESFLKMVCAFGVNRILFGTDSPWSDQGSSVAWIRALPMSEKEKAAILGENAMKLLGR